MQEFWRMTRMEGDEPRATLWVQGTIETSDPWLNEALDICAPDTFRRALEAVEGMPLTVVIDSTGGNVLSGLAMYGMLRQRTGETAAEVHIAYSAATLILAGCDKGRRMLSPGATLLYHNPATIAQGDHRELARSAAFLGKLKESVIAAYMDATGMDEATISTLMDAETVYTAEEAIKAGWADGILKPPTLDRLQGGMDAAAYAKATMQANTEMIRKTLERAEDSERARIALYAREMRERGREA